jgi:hypothetical protein
VSLAEKMTQPPARERVVTECCTLIDEEVKAKGGFTGIAVKGAYSLVKAVKPRFVPEVVDALLDDWVAKMEPFYADWRAQGGGRSLADYFASRGGEIAERLLEVTDERAQGAKTASVKKTYQKLRPSARKHVEEAIPRLGRLVERQVES